MRARGVGRSGGVDDGQVSLLPKRLKCRQRRMQPEESIEVEHRLARDIDAGPHGIILRLGIRDDDVEPIRGTALKNYDQPLTAPSSLDGTVRSAGQKARHGGSADDGERAVAQKDATRDGHEKGSWLLAFSFWLQPHDQIQAKSQQPKAIYLF